MVEWLELHVEKEYEYSPIFKTDVKAKIEDDIGNKLKYILDEVGRLNTANAYYGLVSFSSSNLCPQM